MKAALVAKLGSNPEIFDSYIMPFLLHYRKVGQEGLLPM